jgi:hypothetical protein
VCDHVVYVASDPGALFGDPDPSFGLAPSFQLLGLFGEPTDELFARPDHPPGDPETAHQHGEERQVIRAGHPSTASCWERGAFAWGSALDSTGTAST